MAVLAQAWALQYNSCGITLSTSLSPGLEVAFNYGMPCTQLQVLKSCAEAWEKLKLGPNGGAAPKDLTDTECTRCVG